MQSAHAPGVIEYRRFVHPRHDNVSFAPSLYPCLQIIPIVEPPVAETMAVEIRLALRTRVRRGGWGYGSVLKSEPFLPAKGASN